MQRVTISLAGPPEPFELVNLTPHSLTIARPPFPPIHIPAPGQGAKLPRVAEEANLAGGDFPAKLAGLGIRCTQNNRGKVENLPAPEPNTVFIVAGMVLDHPDLAGRQDIAAPGPAVRDRETGTVIGCDGLRFRSDPVPTLGTPPTLGWDGRLQYLRAMADKGDAAVSYAYGDHAWDTSAPAPGDIAEAFLVMIEDLEVAIAAEEQGTTIIPGLDLGYAREVGVARAARDWLASIRQVARILPESHTDHGLSAEVMAYVLERAGAVPGKVVVTTVNLPSRFAAVPCALRGPTMGDPSIPDELTEMRQRSGRLEPSRFLVRDLPPLTSDQRRALSYGTAHWTEDGVLSADAWKPNGPAPVWKVTVVTGPASESDRKPVLYTMYGGPAAPREPWDPSLTEDERARSVEFWSTHALVGLDEGTG